MDNDLRMRISAGALFAMCNTVRRRLIGSCLILFVALTLAGIWVGLYKVMAIAWIAFAAMALMIPWGRHSARRQVSLHSAVIAYGISAGAMITSAALFLVPQAIHQNSIYGGLGIAVGMIAGFALQQFSQSTSPHFSILSSSVVSELTVHALAAGLVIGMIYATMPRLSLVLGIAIVSHKAPAGYAAARRLTTEEKNPRILLLPAAALGIMALSVSLFQFSLGPVATAIVFGVATGVFLHLGLSFIPTQKDSHLLLPTANNFTIRHHIEGVVSLIAGGLIVFFLWLFFHH